MHTYCSQGLQGIRGDKGDSGRVGLPGMKGNKGTPVNLRVFISNEYSVFFFAL